MFGAETTRTTRVTKRILIIDDSDLIRGIATVCLERAGGWQVLAAASGREGLAAATAEQPDAVLLDLVMPGLDGAATFKELRANPTTCDIPVILLTAREEAFDPHLVVSGVRGIIPKPFDPAGLAHQVAETLGWDR